MSPLWSQGIHGVTFTHQVSQRPRLSLLLVSISTPPVSTVRGRPGLCRVVTFHEGSMGPGYGEPLLQACLWRPPMMLRL